MRIDTVKQLYANTAVRIQLHGIIHYRRKFLHEVGNGGFNKQFYMGSVL